MTIITFKIPLQCTLETSTLDTIQDFLCKLGMKPSMHLVEISIFFSKSCHRQTYRNVFEFIIPYAVKDITIGKDSDVNIVYKYGMEVSLFFITEKGVWHPNFISICQC